MVTRVEQTVDLHDRDALVDVGISGDVRTDENGDSVMADMVVESSRRALRENKAPEAPREDDDKEVIVAATRVPDSFPRAEPRIPHNEPPPAVPAPAVDNKSTLFGRIGVALTGIRDDFRRWDQVPGDSSFGKCATVFTRDDRMPVILLILTTVLAFIIVCSLIGRAFARKPHLGGGGQVPFVRHARVFQGGCSDVDSEASSGVYRIESLE